MQTFTLEREQSQSPFKAMTRICQQNRLYVKSKDETQRLLNQNPPFRTIFLRSCPLTPLTGIVTKHSLDFSRTHNRNKFDFVTGMGTPTLVAQGLIAPQALHAPDIYIDTIAIMFSVFFNSRRRSFPPAPPKHPKIHVNKIPVKIPWLLFWLICISLHTPGLYITMFILPDNFQIVLWFLNLIRWLFFLFTICLCSDYCYHKGIRFLRTRSTEYK